MCLENKLELIGILNCLKNRETQLLTFGHVKTCFIKHYQTLVVSNGATGVNELASVSTR